MRSREEERQHVIDWLRHPNELGCAPKKIEFVREFTDEDEIDCMIFKYKKSVLSPWLLAIASDSGVFSEMQKYNPETEIEDAKKLLHFLKEYWKRMANAEAEREERAKNAEHFHAFVLMKEPEWKPELFEKSFAEEWGVTLQAEASESEAENDESDVDARIYEVNSMRLIMGYMGFPVPGEEAEQNAQFNYMWKDAVEVTKTHKAHMIVTILGEGTIHEKAYLYTKAVTTLCRQENVIGVYADGVVYEPRFFAAMSEMMDGEQLPIFNLVWFGLTRTEGGVSAYTSGLTHFGKDEMEILDSKQKPSELRDFLINIVEYVVTEDVILHEGETIGESNTQRLAIKKSEGVNVEGESLKILM